MRELLLRVEQLYHSLLNCSSTSGKSSNGWAIIHLMREHPEIEKYWAYNEHKHRWNDRFTQIRVYIPIDDYIVEGGYTIVNGRIVDPITDLKKAPSYKGLYLIGQTTFNPYTDDKQYWVKVGYSSDIYQRFRSGYTTTSPCTALLDTTRNTDEYHCHKMLRQVAIGQCQQNDEWFLVDRETYLIICDKKFKYFGF